MEEGERALQEGPTTSDYTPPTSSLTSNGKPPRRVEKVSSPTECGVERAGGGDGFAGIAAKMLNAKVKVQGKVKPGKSDSRNHKQNGCDDDLPLGSEAHSLSLDPTVDFNSKYPLTEDERSAWSRTISQGIMGWQSFSSDVSNHTSASSASLEQLLNDRQVDPEEMLLSLGFGGGNRNMMPTLARVPERFLNHPSRAYGIAPPSLSDELQEEVASDTTDSALPVPVKAPVPAAAVTSLPKRRTGGFSLQGLCLQSGQGYVDVVSLLNKDVPLHFFHDQRSRCYYTLTLSDHMDEDDRSADEQDRGFKEVSLVWENEQRSPSSDRDRVSECFNVAEGEALKSNRNHAGISPARTRTAEATVRSKWTGQDTHTLAVSSQMRTLARAEVTSDRRPALVQQVHCLQDTEGERLSQATDEMLNHLRRKKAISSCLSAQFLKLATHHFSSSWHEAASSTLETNCTQDTEDIRSQDSEGMTSCRSNISPIKSLCQGLSSSCSSLASKLGISLPFCRDVQSENQHGRPGASVGITLPLLNDTQLSHRHDRPGADLPAEYSQSSRFNSLPLKCNTQKDNVTCVHTQMGSVVCGHTQRDSVVCDNTHRDSVCKDIGLKDHSVYCDLVDDSYGIDGRSDDSGDYYEDFYDDFGDDDEDYGAANTEENVDDMDNMNVDTDRDLSVLPVSFDIDSQERDMGHTDLDGGSQERYMGHTDLDEDSQERYMGHTDLDEDSQERDMGHTDLEWCHDGEHLIFDETCMSPTNTHQQGSSSCYAHPHSSSMCCLQPHDSSVHHTYPQCTFHACVHSSPVDYTYPRSMSTNQTHSHSSSIHQIHPYSSSVDQTYPHSFSIYHTHPHNSSVDHTHPHHSSVDHEFPYHSSVNHTFLHKSSVDQTLHYNSSLDHTHPHSSVDFIFPHLSVDHASPHHSVDHIFLHKSSVDHAFPYNSVDHAIPHHSSVDHTHIHSSSVDHTHPFSTSVDHTHLHSSSVDQTHPDMSKPLNLC